MQWRRFLPWHTSYVSFVSPTGVEPERRSAAEQGTVTAVHRGLIDRLAPTEDSTWSERALWGCLDELAASTLTEAAEIRVQQAWPDGPYAFCVIYTQPWFPMTLGLRRHFGDHGDQFHPLGIVWNPWDYSFSDDPTEPVSFGRLVADFDIGEPGPAGIGRPEYGQSNLRFDDHGVGWWGVLDPELPSYPEPVVP